MADSPTSEPITEPVIVPTEEGTNYTSWNSIETFAAAANDRKDEGAKAKAKEVASCP